MGQHDALGQDEISDETARGTSPPPMSPQSAGGAALEQVVTGWVRRGYSVQYRDPYLVQFARRERPGWRGWGGLALTIGLVAVAGTLTIMRARKWHVVTLVIRPDGRILMHQQRSPREPAP